MTKSTVLAIRVDLFRDYYYNTIHLYELIFTAGWMAVTPSLLCLLNIEYPQVK